MNARCIDTRSRFVAVVLSLGAVTVAVAATGGYHLLKKYSFGAAQLSTREYFDYITVDSAARRVYLSHGTEIKVIDADSGTLIGNITGLKQDHGVALAHEFGRGFISDGAQGKVAIFDLKTLKVVGEAKAADDADCVVYDPASKRVFVMEGNPNALTAIDAKSGNVVGTVQLGGSPEFAVADGQGTVYINLESKSEVVALDSRALTIKSRWPVAPAGGPTARRASAGSSNPGSTFMTNTNCGPAAARRISSARIAMTRSSGPQICVLSAFVRTCTSGYRFRRSMKA